MSKVGKSDGEGTFAGSAATTGLRRLRPFALKQQCDTAPNRPKRVRLKLALHYRTGPDKAGSAPGTRSRSSVDSVHPDKDRDRDQHHGAVRYAGDQVHRDGAPVAGTVAQDLTDEARAHR